MALDRDRRKRNIALLVVFLTLAALPIIAKRKPETV